MKRIIRISAILVLFISFSVYTQWSEQISSVTSTLYSVSAFNDNVAWICGAAGKVLRTTNGGVNWNLTSSPNASLDLYNIWAIDSNRALVTGSSTTAYVYKTTNAGVNWTQVFIQTGGFINVIVNLIPPSNQFAMIGDPVGGRWSIWHSGNNGSTWDSVGYYLPQSGSETGYNNSAFEVGSYGSDYFWFGTNNTRIYRGFSGQNWIAQPTPGQANILAIMFTDSLNGIAGGSTGLLYTSNGGMNWVAGTVPPGSGSINGIAIGYSNQYFITRGSTIYQSSNNGLNWTSGTTQTGTYTHMQRARKPDNYNIWAIRNNGGISKYSIPIGIKSINSEIPDSYMMTQNYPNPFNPSTKIKFSIPEAVNIKFIVYDILGREISTLVNELLKPGTYEIVWPTPGKDVSNYPSGVYFYSIKTNEFSETKKMILMK